VAKRRNWTAAGRRIRRARSQLKRLKKAAAAKRSPEAKRKRELGRLRAGIVKRHGNAAQRSRREYKKLRKRKAARRQKFLESLEFLFVLKSEVRMPPRPYIRPAVAESRQAVTDAIAESARRAVRTFR